MKSETEMSKALIKRPPAQLAPAPLPGPPDPFATFLQACSPSSRRTMGARLTAAARTLAGDRTATAESFMWQGLDYGETLRVLGALADAKQAPATINLTRSALRKMAKVLFSLRLLDVEERQRIEDIPPVAGSHLPRRAFTAREIRKLFAI